MSPEAPDTGRLSGLLDRFMGSFDPRVAGAPRRVGREAEFPVVTATGEAGDVMALWPVLLEDEDLEAIVEPAIDDGGLLIVGVEAPTWTASVEVGHGTIELSVGPGDDLFELGRPFADGLQRLTTAADRLGYRLLGYGIQPRTPHGPQLLTPKRRYAAMFDAIGEPWSRFGVTASDQLHVEVGGDELIPLTNLLGALSGALIALTANSPVVGGQPSGAMSGREWLMSEVTGEPGRHGASPRPYRDVPDYLEVLGGFRCLFLPAGDGYTTFEGTFWDYLGDHPELTPAEVYGSFLFHEHYIWQSARPRARLGTLEIRPACQQPAAASWLPSALALGWLENAHDVDAYLEERFGSDVFAVLRDHRDAAVAQGLSAVEPCPDFLATLIDLADKGLRRRARGEEQLLEPARDRVARRRGPADVAIQSFEQGGAAAMVDAFAIEP
jgi:gamma-glutamylcysteine synthetase